MVASGQHAAFVEQYRLGLLIASGMAAGAVLIAALMREPLGYEFGASACVYASEPACAPAYARIFGTAGGRSDDDEAGCGWPPTVRTSAARSRMPATRDSSTRE